MFTRQDSLDNSVGHAISLGPLHTTSRRDAHNCKTKRPVYATSHLLLWRIHVHGILHMILVCLKIIESYLFNFLDYFVECRLPYMYDSGREQSSRQAKTLYSKVI